MITHLSSISRLSIARIPYKGPEGLRSAQHLDPKVTWVPEDSDAWLETARVEFAIFRPFLVPSLSRKREQ